MSVRAAETAPSRTAAVTPVGAVAAWRLRRWVRRRRRAGGAEGAFGTAYVVLLTVLVGGAMIGEPLVGEFWPDQPVPPTALPADRSAALLTLVPLLAYAVLRRIGPVSIGRADLAWLFPAPVARRGLLLPGVLGMLAGMGVLGAVGGLLLVGRVAPRPVEVAAVLSWSLAGVGLGWVVGLVATVAQRYGRPGRLVDAAVLLAAIPPTAVAAGLWRPGPGLPDAVVAGLIRPGAAVLMAGLLLAGAVAGLSALVGWLLGRFPGHLVVEAATVRGGYLDATIAAEPGFLAEQEQRRYWQRRHMRSVRLRRLPRWLLPVQHDLLVLRRRPVRLAALALAASTPAVAFAGPWWLPALVVALGALLVAGTTTDAVRQDSAQPALLRLLGLTARQALAGRLVVPTLLAGGWAVLALAFAGRFGDLRPGPWWALGVALAPTVGTAALRRARAGFVRHDLAHIDTPAGALATGPLLWLLSGVDLFVLFGLPALLALLGGLTLTWMVVIGQAVASVVCAAWFLLDAGRRR
ncbi:DUF6297 family protein [Plantactinospora sp. GCM10030261]|uniref:DUF6297 family protein n=1 Tax=Plantactinospora sp. GCM10030261 TaxID=3273420 RepID=UPI00362191F7